MIEKELRASLKGEATAVPSQSHGVSRGTWLKRGSEKDAGCPGQEQRERKGRGQAGERKEELRREGRARSKNS